MPCSKQATCTVLLFARNACWSAEFSRDRHPVTNGQLGALWVPQPRPGFEPAQIFFSDVESVVIPMARRCEVVVAVGVDCRVSGSPRFL